MNGVTPFQNAVLWFAYLFGMAGVACLMFGFWYLARRQKGRPFLRALLFIGANLAGLRLVYLSKRLITGESTGLSDLMMHALITSVWLTLLSVYGLCVWVRRRQQRKVNVVQANIENVMEDLPITESSQSVWPVPPEETSSAKVILRQSER